MAHLRTIVLGCVASTALVPFSALAAEPPAESTEPEDVVDVVITGSRVITNGNSMPTPVTVVSAQALLDTQPTGVVQALNTIPALIGSLNGTSNANSGGYNQLNLRGVGSTRALVLYNGHRIGPNRPAGQTIVDVIPQMLLQRVDVVTGGTSAVYGSDAVSGVVNFITDTKFNGFKVDAQTGISRYWDDDKTRLGFAWGTEVGERSHFEASYEFFDQSGFNREDRDFWTPSYSIQGAVVQPVNGVTSAAGTAANPYALVRDARFGTNSFGGRINNGPFADLNFASNGVLTPFNHGTRTGTSGVELGGDGAQFVNSTVNTEQRIHRGFARFDFEVTDNIRAHADGTYTSMDQSFRLQNPTLNLTIGYNNPFLDTVTVNSPALTTAQFQATRAAQLAANPLSTFTFGKIDTQLPQYTGVVENKYWMATAGIEGDQGPFGWSVDYYHTNSELRITNLHNLYAGRLLAAANAVRDPATGQIVCAAALANPSVYGSCVPLNVFGPAAANQAAMDYVNQLTTALTQYKTDDFQGTVNVSPFSLPAGEVNLALTGEWRKLTLETVSNVNPVDVVPCTGIQFGCVAPGPGRSATAAYLSPNGANAQATRTPVSQTVKELALEAAVPILADRRFAQAFDVSAAARYTNYDTSGTVYTWKGGAVWQLADSVTLRATRSRDIRAPNLDELFAPVSILPRNYVDLHTGGISAFVNRQDQGNPNLTPEKADTLTVGTVLRPGFLPGFTFTVDYYRIKINNAVINIDPLQGNTQSVCEASNGTDAVCELYVRPLPFSDRTAANFPTLLFGKSLNVASLKTYGMDFEANYTTDINGRGLELRALLNWQPHLIYDNGPSGIIDIGGAADGIGGLPITPKFKALGSVAYDVTDGLRVMVQERWRAALKQNGTAILVYNFGKVSSVAYTDANVNYKVADVATLFFNVQNLFDKKPPPFASNGASSQFNYLGGYAQGDDIEGRYFTAGIRLRF